MPYYFWWVKTMDGRFEPGEDLSFDWQTDPDAAKADAAAKKTGTFLYFYSEKDDHNVETKRVQREVFFDAIVRHFGKRVACVKLKKEKHEELFKSFKLKQTPAIVTLDKKGKKKKVIEGKKIKAMGLAKALRAVAKDQSMPKK
jgi:hypothetical protein